MPIHKVQNHTSLEASIPEQTAAEKPLRMRKLNRLALKQICGALESLSACNYSEAALNAFTLWGICTELDRRCYSKNRPKSVEAEPEGKTDP